MSDMGSGGRSPSRMRVLGEIEIGLGGSKVRDWDKGVGDRKGRTRFKGGFLSFPDMGHSIPYPSDGSGYCIRSV